MIVETPELIDLCQCYFPVYGSNIKDPLCLLVCFLWSAETLSSLKDTEQKDFLQRVCSLLDSSERNTGAARPKLNVLHYLCTLAVHQQVASWLMSSQLVNHKALEESE